ncbi:MAG: UbiD family decarboxylase [Gammaproteobacteria bacterium]|nr:UbiD family decarboxylase [Gammaproteobacteria bacterium]MCP4091488.1 UbiD family decarboxylase [Gammaproteobacteria bacterium]MCP4275398.1 UbiD family decarboxylase [Gammaproteobacteria bacterium]MCP4832286.1 UbiD family decarboxylase [Gammaproteobacteria bacterium]MCP4928139.1 UbiD family decarboxylase [Gammaproteobacteria bacterium]
MNSSRAAYDLRSFAAFLEEHGELVRISKEVERQYELPALLEQLEQQHKAFIFDNIKGASFPLIGGLLNSTTRLGQAIGNDISVPYDHRNHAAAYGAASENPVAHIEVETGPVKDVVITGDDIDLADLPVPTFFELDSGAFITGAVGISQDQSDNRLNMGFYRSLITGKDTLVINASSMSDLRQIYATAEESGVAMPIALAIGVPPALLMAASGKTPPGLSELDLAGGLMGQAVEMVKCETSNLLVPAIAEIVIEGVVDFTNKVENTLGEFAGQYGPETAPTTRVTAITHRKNAMYYSIMAGRNPEHNTIGAISTYGMQRVIAGNLCEQFLNIKDINIACEPKLGAMLHIFISIDKQNDAEPRKLLEAAFAATAGIFPVSMIVKRIVIVDDDIDVYNLEEVEWAIWTRLSTVDKIMTIANVKSWELERCVNENMESARVGIDGTMDMNAVDKLIKPVIPGCENVRLEDYLD